jgi:hypothetical protein
MMGILVPETCSGNKTAYFVGSGWFHITTVCILLIIVTVHSVQCTVYSSQCTVHSVQYTVCSAQCAVHSVQYTSLLLNLMLVMSYRRRVQGFGGQT